MTDRQRQALYEAEDEAMPDGGRRFRRFVDLEAWVEQVVLGDWWAAEFPYAPLEVDINRRSRGATFSAARVEGAGDVATLWIRDGSWNAVTVVHELAHVAAWNRVVDGAHDAAFVTVLLRCWRHLLGFGAYGALRSALDRRGVAYFADRLD